MTGRRRLSESISEGDGISILVEVDAAAGFADVAREGGVALVAPVGGVPPGAVLPVLVRGGSPADAEAAGADAWLLVVGASEDVLAERCAEARELGIECVVVIRDENELERVLTEVDPEIVLLSPRGADSETDAVDLVLDLLPDVPAGKLAVAELTHPTPEDLVALERAGVDAVLVGAGTVAALVNGPEASFRRELEERS